MGNVGVTVCVVRMCMVCDAYGMWWVCGMWCIWCGVCLCVYMCGDVHVCGVILYACMMCGMCGVCACTCKVCVCGRWWVCGTWDGCEICGIGVHGEWGMCGWCVWGGVRGVCVWCGLSISIDDEGCVCGEWGRCAHTPVNLCHDASEHSLWSQTAWIHDSCYHVSKILNFLGSEFPHLWKESIRGAHVQGALCAATHKALGPMPTT